MRDTVVTFIVPTYNSARTLRRCLDSFLDESLFDDMDVLIINDGSTDESASLAMEYVSKYRIFQLISKENGGHGSVINYGSSIARGKYFKVIDSDDWVQTGNLPLYIESLRNSTADVVLTNFRTIDSRNNYIREYAMSGLEFGRVYSFDALWQRKKAVSKVLAFHGITYRTGFYQSCGICLSEGISYEDQEYATLPFASVGTVLPVDVFLYEYSLGDPCQSVSDQNQVKQFEQMLHVFWRVADFTPANILPTASEYFHYKKCGMLLSCYMAALVKNPCKAKGRSRIKQLRKQLKEQSPILHSATRRQYATCLLLSYLRFNGDTLVKLQKMPTYRFFAARMH